MPVSIEILVDADACPVKDEIYKVAERHAAKVYIVSNSFIRIPRLPFIEQIVVEAGPDIADDWIAERAHPHSVVVTADILLAERALTNKAVVLDPKGKPFTAASIGSQVATRALMEQLRSTGDQLGGAPPFSAADRSRFLQALHAVIEKIKRAA